MTDKKLPDPTIGVLLHLRQWVISNVRVVTTGHGESDYFVMAQSLDDKLCDLLRNRGWLT